MIEISNTNIDDCYLLKYDKFIDHRGYFSEIFKQSILPNFNPIQINCSFSITNVLRGIHQTPYAKLVTCLYGKVYDVVVDLRPDSKSYLQYFSVDLSTEANLAIYIPPYCGHGFYTYSESLILYAQEHEYDNNLEKNYHYESFNIRWPIIPNITPIISDKDLISPNYNLTSKKKSLL